MSPDQILPPPPTQPRPGTWMMGSPKATSLVIETNIARIEGGRLAINVGHRPLTKSSGGFTTSIGVVHLTVGKKKEFLVRVLG